MMMDIASWLREVRMSTNTSDWNAAFVNNRLDEAADVIEKLRETNIMQARWLYEAQQENKLFKEKVRQWLDIGKPAAMEGE